MLLSALLAEGDRLAGRAELDPEVSGLSCDTRTLRPGELFAAFAGAKADGRGFVAEALKRGAVALLIDPSVSSDGLEVPALVHADPRRRFARLAGTFFGRQPRVLAAVTGTNGKTSVAGFVRQLWAFAGHPAASLGTLGVVAQNVQGPVPEAPSLTTPGTVALHRLLAELAAQGVEHAVLEASSHGLAQSRLDGLRLQAAAFTNLSRDHLDYHASMEAYLAAKARLFTELLPPGATAVLNADEAEVGGLASVCRERGIEVLTFGAAGEAIRLCGRKPTSEGQRLRIGVAGRTHDVDLNLVGAFQSENVLAALGLALATGVAPETALAALPTLQGAPGRLQRIGVTAGGAAVFVDYAHTPDALANVLAALRPHTTGSLDVVFGCGGDRDRGKRPEMGRIAARLADRTIVTDDNPRGEDPAAIRAEVMAGCPGAREIGDRAAAIREAIGRLRTGDVLVVAGKGHERGQIVGDRVLPFDDAEEVGRALAELEGGAA